MAPVAKITLHLKPLLPNLAFLSSKNGQTDSERSSDFSRRLKEYETEKIASQTAQFHRYNELQQSKQLRSLKNNNFFTAHALPLHRQSKSPVVTEYAFVLPSGLCIYQSQPTTQILPFKGDPNWNERILQFEHAGWQVLGTSGDFVVFSRQKNLRQSSVKRVKVIAGRYGRILLVLTAAIFAGGAITSWMAKKRRLDSEAAVDSLENLTTGEQLATESVANE